MFCSMLALAGIAFPEACGAAPPTHRVIPAPRYERPVAVAKPCPKGTRLYGDVCFEDTAWRFRPDEGIAEELQKKTVWYVDCVGVPRQTFEYNPARRPEFSACDITVAAIQR